MEGVGWLVSVVRWRPNRKDEDDFACYGKVVRLTGGLDGDVDGERSVPCGRA